MAVRTKRLFAGRSGASGQTVAYSTPVGDTTIVKHVSLYGRAATPSWLIIQVAPSSGPHVLSLLTFTLGNAEWRQVEVWWVLHPGDEIRINKGVTDGYDVHISGTELEGVAG